MEVPHVKVAKRGAGGREAGLGEAGPDTNIAFTYEISEANEGLARNFRPEKGEFQFTPVLQTGLKAA